MNDGQVYGLLLYDIGINKEINKKDIKHYDFIFNPNRKIRLCVCVCVCVCFIFLFKAYEYFRGLALLLIKYKCSQNGYYYIIQKYKAKIK